VNPLASVALTLLWGGLVAADTAAFLQLLLSQPFVAGAVTGALWGRMEVGLEIGAILQLFSLGVLPVGGRAPEDFPVGTVVGVAAACFLTRVDPVASAQGGPLLFGLLVAFVVALVGRPLLVWLRHRNERLARWVEQELAAGNLAALGRAQSAGIAQTFAFGLLWTALALCAAAWVGQALFAHASVAFGRAWHVGSPLLWGFGAGLVTKGLTRGRKAQVVFWCALVAFVALRLWSTR
jgi:mannose/fructose/N-acetylgalactosamine-specific phosphotransferase system component IIC